MHQTVSKDQLIADARALGIEEGDHLALGISLKNVGTLQGGPDMLLEALLECTGPRGTLMVNTFTQTVSLRVLQKARDPLPVFDHRTTPSDTGAFAERFRQHPKAIRSRHPTNSVAAIGRQAEYLTGGHDANAPSYSPYSRLADLGGKMLCIGIGDNLVALRHEAQYLAGLLSVVPFDIGALYRGEDGTVRVFMRRDKGGCTRELPLLVPQLRGEGLVRDGRIGRADSLAVKARESLEFMTRELGRAPECYLCEEVSCLWCRELERRLKLHDRIASPRYFQKYAIVRIALALLNRRRLKK